MIRVTAPLLSQNNAIWSRQLLGFSRRTLGTHGCGVTCLTMLLNSVTQTTHYSPLTVNSALRERSAFCGPWSNYVDWPVVPSIWPCLSYKGRLDCPDTPASKSALNEIDRRLNIGLPVIIYVDASPETGLQQHFVLVVGITEDGDNYIVNNPWRGTQHLLCPQYSTPIAVAVCGILFYDRGQTT